MRRQLLNWRIVLWIMSRTPALPKGVYERLVEQVRELGYDTSPLRELPQGWSEVVRRVAIGHSHEARFVLPGLGPTAPASRTRLQ